MLTMQAELPITVIVTGVTILFCCVFTGGRAQHQQAWGRPGCHLVGYTKEVRIPGCHMEEVPMNACRGYCLSYSYPSTRRRLLETGGRQIMTTHGTCCTIQETHDVNVWLRCEYNEQRLVTFRSAAACECSLCEIQPDIDQSFI